VDLSLLARAWAPLTAVDAMLCLEKGECAESGWLYVQAAELQRGKQEAAGSMKPWLAMTNSAGEESLGGPFCLGRRVRWGLGCGGVWRGKKGRAEGEQVLRVRFDY
jgi:hypothetical protein